MTEQTERLSLADLRTEAKNRRCELVTNEFLEDLLRRSNRLADLEREKHQSQGRASTPAVVEEDLLMERHDVEKLARYNAEVARGIVHTTAWAAKMRLLQMRFDDEQRKREGVIHLQPPAESLKGQAPPDSPDPLPQP
jgi:hypothetical protein